MAGHVLFQLDVHSLEWYCADVLQRVLRDNALDACEEDSVAPVVTVGLDGDSVSVTDNGPGLPEDTLRGSLNYMVKVSNKTRYVSPTRGRQGNALKCVWAAPFVYNGERGQVEVITPRYAYEVSVVVNKLHQKPQVDLIPLNRPFVKNGTVIKVWWQKKASFISDSKPGDFYKKALNLLQSYATFNPHAGFHLCQDGETLIVSDPLVTSWQKWLPSDPTSPHWYSVDDFSDLLRAQVTNGQSQKTVRQFVSEFCGLTSTAKQQSVAAQAGLSGQILGDLVTDGDLDADKVERLLKAMRAASKPVKASKLGAIGKEAMIKRLIEVDGIAAEGVLNYVKQVSDDVMRPHIVEVAIGHRQDREKRRIRFGLNFSPTLDIPFPLLRDWLGEAMMESRDPLCISVHVTTPRFDYIGRSKSMLVQGDPGENDEDQEEKTEEEEFLI